MTQPITHTQQSAVKKSDEEILVVKRSILFAEYPSWHGLQQQIDFQQYLSCITSHQEFYPRSLMETDPTYKQIIPYLVFKHANRYFLMQRHAQASEQRLKNKLTLGIGGHIRKEDITGVSIYDWATREFHEEVHYNGTLSVSPFGVLNDESNDVGKVHIGFVFILEGDSPDIYVKSELAHGSLVSLDTCLLQKEDMESWSQFIVNALV